jgi:hypothetical protein
MDRNGNGRIETRDDRGLAMQQCAVTCMRASFKISGGLFPACFCPEYSACRRDAHHLSTSLSSAKCFRKGHPAVLEKWQLSGSGLHFFKIVMAVKEGISIVTLIL